jgi:hypothetical protein
MGAELGAELAGSEFRADVAPKDESVGMAKKLDDESMRRRAEKTAACLKALAPKVSGSAVVAEFSAARSDGGFEATGPAEAEGDGDGWHGATVTAAAPAHTAGAANFTGNADNVGASVGADGASGAVAAPEAGQTWADVGGFDLYPTCIVDNNQAMADREELAGGGTKTMGAGHSMEEVAQAMERWPGRWPGLSIEETKENMDAMWDRRIRRERKAQEELKVRGYDPARREFWVDVDR